MTLSETEICLFFSSITHRVFRLLKSVKNMVAHLLGKYLRGLSGLVGDALQVLERDLAIFGFFIALGRSTQSFLAANGFSSLENPVEDLVR